MPAVLRGFFLTDPDEALAFPKAESVGSLPIQNYEGDLVLKTEHGKTWVYKQFRGLQWTLQFRLTETQLQFFRDLHDLVQGQETPFYFVEDIEAEGSAGTLVAYYVRKEAEFRPTNEQIGIDPETGEETLFYDYTLELTQEPTDDEIGP